MAVQVVSEECGSKESLSTQLTFVLILESVGPQLVPHQCSTLSKALETDVTLERPFTSVHQHMLV